MAVELVAGHVREAALCHVCGDIDAVTHTLPTLITVTVVGGSTLNTDHLCVEEQKKEKDAEGKG